MEQGDMISLEEISLLKIFFFYLCFFICIDVSFANGSVKWLEGDPIGEPVGRFKQIGIEEEYLLFDARPVQSRKSVKIKAVYQIQNDGEPFNAEMTFIAPGAQTGEVRINQQVVSCTTIPLKNSYPEEWLRPNIYPEWSWRHFINQFVPTVFSFKMPFHSGKNTLEVSYEAVPTESHLEFFIKYHINYALFPVKHWAYFRKLHVDIYFPKGWTFQVSEKMQQDKNRLYQTFEGLPANGFSFYVTPKTNKFTPYLDYLPIFGVFIGLYGGYLFSFFLARGFHKLNSLHLSSKVFLYFFIMSLSCVFTFFLVYIAVIPFKIRHRADYFVPLEVILPIFIAYMASIFITNNIAFVRGYRKKQQ